nr:MAG TPA: hypothetical protein [Caudoviricetes sp.]
MKKAISFILALLAAVGKECYQTFVLGLVAAAVTAVLSLVCGLSLWTALPVVALVALLLARLVAKTRAVKFSRGETIAYAVGNLATWLLLVAGYLVK